MQFFDSCAPKGRLQLFSVVDGVEELIFDEANTVTYDGRSMLNFSAAGERAIDPISFIGVGTGGYLPGPIDPDNDPPAPDPEMSQLNIEIIRKSVVKPINHSTRLISIFEATLNENEAVGAKLTEFGLFTLGNILFARRTTRPVTKIDRMILRMVWTIMY